MIWKLHGLTKKFDSLEELQDAVAEACSEPIIFSSFGYIEPGHGSKGKQRWLTSNDDLKDMYQVYQGKKEILLWCNTMCSDKRKRAHSPNADSDNSKRAKSSGHHSHLDKMTEVEAVEEELRKKHANGP